MLPFLSHVGQWHIPAFVSPDMPVGAISNYSVPAVDFQECALLCAADERCTTSQFHDQLGTCTIEAWGEQQERGLLGSEGRRRRVLLVTYAAGPRFETTQRLLDESLPIAEIQEHWRWTASSLQEGIHGEWYRQHQAANFRRGGAWKPYIIWQALRRARWGEWVIYHDASQYVQEGFRSSVQPLLSWLERHRDENPCECLAAVRLRQTLQHEWEQQCVPPYGPEPRDLTNAFDVFCRILWRVGACTASLGVDCCRRLWRKPTHQHAWSVWRKNLRSARFLQDWAERSADYESVAHLPFVDQSLNALLVYKWHAQLGIRPLWAPSLYQMAWDQELDTGSLGRNDGFIFKHLNFFLDALWNEELLGRRFLWLVDPEAPAEKVPGASPQFALWDQGVAPAALWRQSLCLAPTGRPDLSARPVTAQLLLDMAASSGEIQRRKWGGRYKAVAGWSAAIHSAPTAGEVPRSWLAALPRHFSDMAEAIGEQALFERGLSSALSLGSWRLDLLPRVATDAAGSNIIAEATGSKQAPWVVAAIAELVVLNDGKVPWLPGAHLCPAQAGGINATAVVRAEMLCQHGSTPPSSACGALPGGEVALLQLFIPARAAHTTHGWQEAEWSLCDANGLPFGMLLKARLRFA